ncbi:hypothetical protein FB451DRAFT_1366937 [Mycena latifolia]|nr:hypothetical protein FB451DRAFT_1366937 [Mycena latifolia]
MSDNDTYELLYFRLPVWSKVDVTLLVLELTGAKYEYINCRDDWDALKGEQKFGQAPRLTVKKADGTSQASPGTGARAAYLWESLAIELYLGEKLGLLSTDLFERATTISILSALRAIQDTISGAVPLLDPEVRAAKHEKFITETIPTALKWHEALLEKSGGPYYAGDAVSNLFCRIPPLTEDAQITLPDLVLLALYLRYRDTYGETNPFNKFPKLMQLIETLLAGKLGEFVRERRDPGVVEWDREKHEFVLSSVKVKKDIPRNLKQRIGSKS